MTVMPIRCPKCGDECHVKAPDDACLFFYTCECCGFTMRALPGDCCVICSYSDNLCPPMQAEE